MTQRYMPQVGDLFYFRDEISAIEHNTLFVVVDADDTVIVAHDTKDPKEMTFSRGWLWAASAAGGIVIVSSPAGERQ